MWREFEFSGKKLGAVQFNHFEKYRNFFIVGQYETHIPQKYNTMFPCNRKNLGILNIVQKP